MITNNSNLQFNAQNSYFSSQSNFIFPAFPNQTHDKQELTKIQLDLQELAKHIDEGAWKLKNANPTPDRLSIEIKLCPAEQLLLKWKNKIHEVVEVKKSISKYDVEPHMILMKKTFDTIEMCRSIPLPDPVDRLEKNPTCVVPKIPEIYCSFKLKGGITLTDIRKKAEQRGYKNQLDAAKDLSQVVCFIGNENVYVRKKKCIIRQCYFPEIISKTELKGILSKTSLYKDKKSVTLWDVVENLSEDFTKSNYDFYSADKDTLSHFGGYIHPIQLFAQKQLHYLLDVLIRDVICSRNNDVFNYVLNWFAFIAQNPGARTNVAIIITGVFYSIKKQIHFCFLFRNA